MGIITRTFSLLPGIVLGIYIAQNYNVPDIRKIVHETLFTAKQVEEKYRKPKRPGDDAV